MTQDAFVSQPRATTRCTLNRRLHALAFVMTLLSANGAWATIPCRFAPTFVEEFATFSASEQRYILVSGVFSEKRETSRKQETVEDGLFKGTAEGTIRFTGHIGTREGFNTPVSQTVSYYDWFDDALLTAASAPVDRPGVYFLGVPDTGPWTFRPSSFYGCETRSHEEQRAEALTCLLNPQLCGAKD